MSKLNPITLYEHLLRKKNTHNAIAGNGSTAHFSGGCADKMILLLAINSEPSGIRASFASSPPPYTKDDADCIIILAQLPHSSDAPEGQKNPQLNCFSSQGKRQAMFGTSIVLLKAEIH